MEVEVNKYEEGWDNGYNQGYTDAAMEDTVVNRKTSDKLESILCDPDGKISITGSNEDKKILQEALKEVYLLEKYVDSLKQIVNSENGVMINIKDVKDEKIRGKILFAWKVFGNFPNDYEI